MKRIYAIVVCLVLLVFAAAFAIPAEDLPWTAYDESEPQPYECAPQVASIIAHAAAAAVENVSHAVPTASSPEPKFDLPHLALAHTPGHFLAPNPGPRVFPIRC